MAFLWLWKTWLLSIIHSDWEFLTGSSHHDFFLSFKAFYGREKNHFCWPKNNLIWIKKFIFEKKLLNVLKRRYLIQRKFLYQSFVFILFWNSVQSEIYFQKRKNLWFFFQDFFLWLTCNLPFSIKNFNRFFLFGLFGGL